MTKQTRAKKPQVEQYLREHPGEPNTKIGELFGISHSIVARWRLGLGIPPYDRHRKQGREGMVLLNIWVSKRTAQVIASEAQRLQVNQEKIITAATLLFEGENKRDFEWLVAHARESARRELAVQIASPHAS